MLAEIKKINSTHDSFYRKGKGRRIGARLIRRRARFALKTEAPA